jgi:hypothetical protein
MLHLLHLDKAMEPRGQLLANVLQLQQSRDRPLHEIAGAANAISPQLALNAERNVQCPQLLGEGAAVQCGVIAFKGAYL